MSSAKFLEILISYFGDFFFLPFNHNFRGYLGGTANVVEMDRHSFCGRRKSGERRFEIYRRRTEEWLHGGLSAVFRILSILVSCIDQFSIKMLLR